MIDWVDDTDPVWNAEREKYSNREFGDKRNVRYRDWDLLRYWFRSVEINAPWVNNIYFVTYGHVPSWLNVNNSKIKIVKHSDYIPKQYLPTFNSNVIELMIHKIPELSDNFVFFNDDFFINAKVKKSDFFYQDGTPRDSGILSPQIPKENSITHITTNNVEIINKYFSRHDVIRNFFKFVNFKYGKQNIKTIATLPWNIILGFQDLHIPISFEKSTFEKVWSLEEKQLKDTLKNKFRTNQDYNIWIFRYFQLLLGDFKPREFNFGKYYDISDNNNDIIQDIKNATHSLIVLNDQDVQNYNEVKLEIQNSFQERYPRKSEFEK